MCRFPSPWLALLLFSLTASWAQRAPGVSVPSSWRVQVRGQAEYLPQDGHLAWQFPADGSYLHLQPPAFQRELTLSLWVKPVAGALEQHIASQRVESEDPQFTLIGGEYSPPDHAYLAVPANGGDFTLPIGQWSHLVLKRDRFGHALFLNGQRILGGPSVISYAIDPAAITIGADNRGGRRWAGLIRDIKVLDFPIEDAEAPLLAQTRYLGTRPLSPTQVTLLQASAGLLCLAIFAWLMVFRKRGGQLLAMAQAYRMTLLAAFTGLVATFALTILLTHYVYAHDKERFDAEITTRRTILDGTITIYTQALERLAASVGSASSLSTDQWHALISQLDAHVHFPAVREIGWLRRLAPSNTPPASSENNIQLRLAQHAFITPTGTPPRSSAQIGADFASDPVLAKPALGALLTSRIYASPLHFETVGLEKRAFFSICVPVGSLSSSDSARILQNDSPPPELKRDSPLPRTAGNSGILYCTIDLTQLIHGMYGFQKADVGFEIYGGDRPILHPGHRYFLSHPYELPERSYFEATLPLRVYWTRWYMHFYSLDRFNQRSLRLWPWYAAAFGAICTTLVTCLLALQTAARNEQQRISAELRKSRDELQTALTEREKISRELHDGAIQSLYSRGLEIMRVAAILKNHPDDAKERLSSILRGIQEVIRELRGALSGLATHESEMTDLDTRLSALVHSTRANTPAEIELIYDPQLPALDPAAAKDLFNIVREALSNALRHAHATRILISVRQFEDELELCIEDNGRGFDIDETSSRGHGLNNMESRAEEWAGRLQLESHPGHTRIVAILPLKSCVRHRSPSPSPARSEALP